jgi:hypothetical protein
VTRGLAAFLRENSPGPAKVPKYRNKKTEVGGHEFASRKEARRYGDLKLMERAGEIRLLRLQPKYPLIVNEKKVAEYWADFAYFRTSDNTLVIEDVKSPITRKNPLYRLKFKIMAAMGLQVTEV